jgi:hypothetical protein
MDSSWIKTIDAGKTSIKNDVYDWFIGSLLELPDGRLLSVVGNLSDGADVKIWDIEENTCLKTCPEKCLWPNPLLVVSENSQIIAFRSDYSSTVLWNIEKNETEILGSGHYVLPLSFIAHRKQGGRSCVYDMETRSFLFKTNTNIANFDTATLLLPNKIAFISDDKKCLIIHDFKNNIVDRFVAHKADISSLTVIRIDENVSLLFSADMNGVLHVWFNGVPSHKKDAINPFYSFVFPYGIKHLDTDGKYLFIVFNDNSIKILRIKNYLEAIEKDFSRLLNII